MSRNRTSWYRDGVRIVRQGGLDFNVPSWPGMRIGAAITKATAGASKIWAGASTIAPDAKTGPHHHGAVETVVYIVRGQARMRWGDRLEFFADAGPGDFIYVPPYVPHQEMNASKEEELVSVVFRNTDEPIVVKLPITPADSDELVPWVDGNHPTE